MAKLTKRHYNRKLLAFGLMLFLSVALISTGFAAWVISNGASAEGEGDVTVGVIKDGGLEFTDIIFKDNAKTFKFEPAKDDNSGDIKWDEKAPEEYEVTEITFTTTVEPAAFIDELKIKMTVPAGVQAAADQGFLALPAYVGAEVVLLSFDENTGSLVKNTEYDDVFSYSVENDILSLTFTIDLDWGSLLSNDGETNPSEYLDEAINEETGEALYSFDEKMDLITEFRRALYNYKDASDYGITEDASIAEFNTDVATLSPAEFKAKYESYVMPSFAYSIALTATAR